MIWVVRSLPIFVLSASATAPIVDQAGVDRQPYQADLKACQHDADQVNSGQVIATKEALTDLFGGSLSMAVGDGLGSKKAAGAGVTAGGAKGLADLAAKKASVARQCLRSLGYILYD